MIVPEGWSKQPLSRLAEVQTGVAKGNGKVGEPVSLPYLRVANVQDGYLDLSEIKFIEIEKSKIDRYSLQYGDVLLTEGGDFDKLGRGCMWRGQIESCIHQNHVFVVRTDSEQLLPEFLSYQTSSSYGKSYFLACAKQSTNLASINSTQLKGFPVLLPTVKEQSAIIDALSTWDRAIEKTEALIAAKERRKKGLMQQLLTGRVRFGEFVTSEGKRKTSYYDLPEDWGYPTIGEVARQVSVKNTEGAALPVLSCTKHAGLVDSLAYFGKQVFSKDLSTYKVVPRDAFAYATNHIEEGSIGYQNLYDEAVISPMYTVFKTAKAVHDGFLFKLLKTEWYRHIFEVRTSASVDRRGSLRWKEFAKIRIPLPSMPEQERISHVVDVADNEIQQLNDKLSALKEQKKGLMQQLLTGKVRVKGV